MLLRNGGLGDLLADERDFVVAESIFVAPVQTGVLVQVCRESSVNPELRP